MNSEQRMTCQMQIGIHQLPNSVGKFLLLTFQHVFAMFGANILVPILVNQAAGFEVIPLQVAFLCSGVGTIIYLFITGFKTPIYLGSSFAFLGGMTTLYAMNGQITGGYNVFFSLMVVGLIYVILAMIIYFTKKASSIRKLLPPIIVGPAIIIIGWSLMTNAASDAFLNPSFIGSINSSNIDLLWAMISISIFTLLVIIIAMVFLKGIWRMIPILLGLICGVIFSILVWGIAKGVGNNEISEFLYGSNNKGLELLLRPSEWTWYPDITKMWKQNVANHTGFRIEVYLALVPLAIVTISEHIGDHINIGKLTGNNFIDSNPGLHRTLLGDGIATIVSALFGGPANTSYGENTSVISITKVASVWVILGAAIISVIISFIAPISILLNAIPKPVLGGVEIILYTMIGINGLRILIDDKPDLFNPKNIIIISILVVAGLGGTIIIFLPSDVIGSQVALSGVGVGVIISIILNCILPDKNNSGKIINDLKPIDFSPSDFMKLETFKKRNKIENYAKKLNKNPAKNPCSIALMVTRDLPLNMQDVKKVNIYDYLSPRLAANKNQYINLLDVSYDYENLTIHVMVNLFENSVLVKKYHVRLIGFKDMDFNNHRY